eukprot:UN01896
MVVHNHHNYLVVLSQIVKLCIFPYPINSPTKWTIELFMSPTEHLFYVFLAFLFFAILCVIIITILHLQESIEHKKEKESQRLFAF